MRKLFMSDIHGHHSEMIQLLEAAEYNPEADKIVIGGDMINRGPSSGLVVKVWKTMQEVFGPEQVKVLAGNHEDMLRMAVTGRDGSMFVNCGGYETLDSIENVMDEEEAIAWLINLPYMHTDDEYFYVHAGVNPKYSEADQRRDDVLWMPFWPSSGCRFPDSFTESEIFRVTGGRKVIYGHTPRSYIFDTGTSMGCDLGCGVKKEGGAKLALVDLTNDLYWYYDFDRGNVNKRKIARKRTA